MRSSGCSCSGRRGGILGRRLQTPPWERLAPTFNFLFIAHLLSLLPLPPPRSCCCCFCFFSLYLTLSLCCLFPCFLLCLTNRMKEQRCKREKVKKGRRKWGRDFAMAVALLLLIFVPCRFPRNYRTCHSLSCLPCFLSKTVWLLGDKGHGQEFLLTGENTHTPLQSSSPRPRLRLRLISVPGRSHAAALANYSILHPSLNKKDKSKIRCNILYYNKTE